MDVVSRIKLLFTSSGSAKAAKETEKVGRAQTRLGQASASYLTKTNTTHSFLNGALFR